MRRPTEPPRSTRSCAAWPSSSSASAPDPPRGQVFQCNIDATSARSAATPDAENTQNSVLWCCNARPDPDMDGGVSELAFPARPLSDGVVTLRPHRDEDVAVFAAMGEDPDIRRWISLPDGYGEQQARDFARENEVARRRGEKVFLVVTAARTGEVVGDCEVHLADGEARVGELGYLLLPAARGRGYATRTVRLL